MVMGSFDKSELFNGDSARVDSWPDGADRPCAVAAPEARGPGSCIPRSEELYNFGRGTDVRANSAAGRFGGKAHTSDLRT